MYPAHVPLPRMATCARLSVLAPLVTRPRSERSRERASHMPTSRVLVSHDSREAAFCHLLVAELRSMGAEVWYDERDLDWNTLRGELEREMPMHPTFIAVLSSESLKSPRVRLALDLALELRRTNEVRECLAVLAEPCTLPADLADFTLLDATSGVEAARPGLYAALGFAVAPSDERAVMPAAQARPTAQLPRTPTVLPPRLDQLGYRGWRAGDVEFIIPPLVVVRGGPFQMGSTEDPGEGPPHVVEVATFAIAAFPVTVAEYACFLRGGHRLPPDAGRVTWSVQFSRLEHPVVNVSWQDAVAYCAWLADCTGEPWGLPSEAEWEKAARWDEKTRTAREYPWGQPFDPHRCNTRESGIGTTTPVGMYPAGVSAVGAQDMAGNVREWTSTRYASYPYERLDGREQADVPGDRVQRGGCWFSFASDARSAFRDWHGAAETSSVVGFRLALAAPQQVGAPSEPLRLPGD